jgi:hypothetical protein
VHKAAVPGSSKTQDVLEGLLDRPFNKGLFDTSGLGLVDGPIGLGSLLRDDDYDDGHVDFAAFKRAVRHQQRDARRCLDRARREHPRLRAQIEIDFIVEADGTVRNSGRFSNTPLVSSSVPKGDDEHSAALAALEDCLSRAVGSWKIGPESLRNSSMSYWYHLRY